MDALIIIVFAAFGVGLFLFRSHLEQRPRRRREEALRDVAVRIGFTYERDRNPFGQQPPLDPGLARILPQLERAFYGYPHSLRGMTAVGSTTVFDVWFSTVGRRSTATSPCKLTLIAFHLADRILPEFSVYPEGRLHKVRDTIFKFYTETVARAWRDLDFPEHPVFSDRYSLHGRDEDATRALFAPARIALWESLPIEERWAGAGIGHSLVLYRAAPWTAGRQQEIPADQIDVFVSRAVTIAAAFRD